jgi:hypothetical protein
VKVRAPKAEDAACPRDAFGLLVAFGAHLGEEARDV